MTEDFAPEELSREEVERALANAARVCRSIGPTNAEPPKPVQELVSVGGIDPASIPLLKWTIRNFLLCGEVTLLGGMGGVGKSLFGWNVAASVAAGKAFAWFDKPEAPAPVIVLSGEDDTYEVWRRVSAYCRGTGIALSELGDRLLVYPDTSICLAVKEGVSAKPTPLALAIRKWIEEKAARLLIIDPMIKVGNGFDENSNGDMEALFSVVRGLVAGTDCACLVLDHFAKSGDGSSQNAVRGASAKVNASRCTCTLSLMPENEYRNLRKQGFAEPRECFPIFQTPKMNYGKRTGVHMFQLVEQPVGNGEIRPAYLKHDPAAITDPRTWLHREAFLAMVEKGIDGEPYRASTGGPAAKETGLRDVGAGLIG